MASTPEAAALTEAHRVAQARLGAAVVRRMLGLWPVLDMGDLDGSFPSWVRAVAPVVTTHRSASSQLAARYVSRFRALELADLTPFAPVIEGPVDPRALLVSLRVTGPVTVKRALAAGADLAEAAATAKAESSRAAMRHSLDGGRGTVRATIDADPLALGWARVTSGRPCHFCALLASRGPVYKSDSTAGFDAHDGCSCATEPVYHADAEWPPGSRDYADLYEQATAGGVADPLNAFRRAFSA